MIQALFRYQGIVYRGHNPKWSYSPLSGDGAARHGGRFNPKGVEALYTSESVEGAWSEAQQGFPFKTQPLTICAYHVDCDAVLDLTDSAVLNDIGFTQQDLNCAWELILAENKLPQSWILAQALIEQSVAAIKVPSYAQGSPSGACNLIFWNWSAHLPHKVTVIDDNKRLPKNIKSWN